MTKQAWTAHMADLGLKVQVQAKDEAEASLAHMRSGCQDCAARRRTRRANRRRQEYSDAMRSLGLVKTPYGWE